VAATFGGATPALADDQINDALATYWDGPTLDLRWDSRTDQQVERGHFYFSGDVAIPGDWVHRTLSVRNDGPCPANLTVEVVNPQATDHATTLNGAGAADGSLAEVIDLRWKIGNTEGSIPFDQLVTAGQLTLATVPLAQAGLTKVAIGHEFPYDQTAGRHLSGVSEELSFDVELFLQGDYCEVVTPTPSPSPSTPGPTSPPPTSKGKGSGPLPFTGADSLAVIAVAAAASLVGLSLFWSSRRRTKSDQ
jgi:hypothetical protein